MKIMFVSTGNSPDFYSFDGEIVTAYSGEVSEDFDLSPLENDGLFESVVADTLDIDGGRIIRGAFRDDEGELHVTLCQAVGPGNWGESDWMDANTYDPDAIHVEFRGRSAGKPWALTRQGRTEPEGV